MARKQVSRKRKVKKNIESGVAHIRSTFNNTIVTITDEFGNALSWSSAGALGFKGSKKSTPFAAQMASETASKTAMEHGLKTRSIYKLSISKGLSVYELKPTNNIKFNTQLKTAKNELKQFYQEILKE